MLAYLLRRLAYGALTVQGVLLLLFVLFFLYAKPEDMARRALGEKTPPEALQQWIANHGYDRPRFWNPADPGQTLLADGEAPAIYHVLSGRACVEIDGADPIDAGPGATIGLAETLAGVPTVGRVRALQAGRALRIDRDELLDVLAERFDLLHGIVLTLLSARETAKAAAPRLATE